MNWKLSTKILLSSFIFMFVNVILTAYILRSATRKVDLTQKYRHKNEIRQPFKHLVFVEKFDSLHNAEEVRAVSGSITFLEGSTTSAVTHANTKNRATWTNFRVESDTLFVELSHQDEGFFKNFAVDVCAPNLESISTHLVSLNIIGVKTKDLRLKSWGNSEINISNQNSNLSNVFAEMYQEMTLKIDTSFHVLRQVDINLHDQAKLFLPDMAIEKFNFKGEPQTKIEAPSKFFK